MMNAYFYPMNYLAHLFLSGSEAEIMAGNFLTDFLTLKEQKKLPAALQPGVQLHLKIDNFTDSHPIVKGLNEFLRDSQGKYAPVALDIIFDYFLCYNWDKYADIEYRGFCQYVYIVLERFLEYVPDRDKIQIQSMIDHRWLSVYTSLDGLHRIMDGMDRRTKFPSRFYKSIKLVEDNFSYFNAEFNKFFPEIHAYITSELSS